MGALQPAFRRWAAPRPICLTGNACFRRNRVGEGEARPTGRTRTVKGSETGVVRPAARSARTRPRRRRRHRRRLSFDFPGPVCWADKQTASCQGRGERAPARRAPALPFGPMRDARPARLSPENLDAGTRNCEAGKRQDAGQMSTAEIFARPGLRKMPGTQGTRTSRRRSRRERSSPEGPRRLS